MAKRCLIVVLTILQGHSRVKTREGQPPIKLSRPALGSPTRDFLVYASTLHNKHEWKLPFLLDTGSWDVWVEADSVAALRNNGARGYVDNVRRVAAPGPKVLTYGYGHTVEFEYAIREKLDFGRDVRADVLLWISTRFSPSFAHSFGAVGTLGAEISSEFARQVGQFSLIPRNGRMEMFAGEFRFNHFCRKKIINYVDVRRIGSSHERWNVVGSVGVHAQGRSIRSVPAGGVRMKFDIMLDTGMPGIELASPLWNAFTSIMTEIGSPIYESGGISYAENCQSYLDRFPLVSVEIGEFSHYIRPRAYVVSNGNYCQLRIYHKQVPLESPQMFLGSNFIRYVISHWDATNFRMGFCNLALKSGR